MGTPCHLHAWKIVPLSCTGSMWVWRKKEREGSEASSFSHEHYAALLHVHEPGATPSTAESAVLYMTGPLEPSV